MRHMKIYLGDELQNRITIVFTCEWKPQCCPSILKQGLANDSLWTTYGPLPVLVNKVLLEHSYTLHLHFVCGYFCTITGEMSSCKRDHMAQKSKIFTLWSFTEKSLIIPAINLSPFPSSPADSNN